MTAAPTFAPISPRMVRCARRRSCAARLVCVPICACAPVKEEKMSRTQPREGWWFSDDSGVLPHGDGRPIVIGQKLSIKGKLVICRNALHGSFDPFDALQYAPGGILHRVLFSGARIEESNKVGSRSRTVLASRDATIMLRRYACDEALLVAHLWDMPPIVREYLETCNEAKRGAASDAAWDAGWDAGWDATRDA